jgi:hypothetical protein
MRINCLSFDKFSINLLLINIFPFLLIAVTESLFGGAPPANSPFLPVAPLELVAKNFHSGTVAFSQVSPQCKFNLDSAVR